MPTRSSSLGNNVSTAVDREIGSQYDNVRVVAENIESVVTVADHIENVDTVATNIVDVHAVGGSIVDVRTVAANISNVVAVGQDITNVNTVAANADNIDMIVAKVIPNIAEIANSSANAAIATTKANEAATSAANALISEQNAKASELAAGVSEDNAAASEVVAITKAGEASASATAARNSELAAAAMLDAFDDRYLGSFTVDPTTDNDGQPLLDGALYYNTVNNVLKVYDVSSVMWYTIPQVQLSTLLDVQLTSVTTGDVLTWNGSKWINTRDVILDSLQLRGGTGTQGTFSWNADEETVDLIQNGAVLQLGQEVQTHVRNATASTIGNGKVVMVTGTIGASGRITVGLYDGVSEVKYILGVCTEGIVAGDDGKVTHFGKIRGIDTSAWNEGDLLYPTTNGDFTNVAPTSGVKLALAIVITKHATNGTIMVRANGVNENAYEPKNANIQTHITSTSNPHNVTKAQVGLGNVDNTADSVKNVATAMKWATARTLTLSGGASGSATLDGSADATLTVTVANDSHTHMFSNLTSKPTTVSGYGITDVYTKTETDSALSLKAPLASPTFTGVPSGPTAVAGTSTTQLATTEFVTTGLTSYVSKSGDTMSGNLNFASGTKITGDFNNAVNANRTAFQSTNTGGTQINVIPNNTTAGAAMHWYYGSSDIANTSRLRVGITSTNEAWINSDATGTGVYAPIVMHSGGAERVRIDTSGNVLVTSPAGLGYGTGSGGSVTQLTSKSTTVTLNKPCGQIAMNNASLAAGATVSFVLSNSLVSVNDIFVVTLGNGTYSPSAYNVWGYASNGACGVFIKNISGASLSEAVPLNFAIIKGAIS